MLSTSKNAISDLNLTDTISFLRSRCVSNTSLAIIADKSLHGEFLLYSDMTILGTLGIPIEDALKIFSIVEMEKKAVEKQQRDAEKRERDATELKGKLERDAAELKAAKMKRRIIIFSDGCENEVTFNAQSDYSSFLKRQKLSYLVPAHGKSQLIVNIEYFENDCMYLPVKAVSDDDIDPLKEVILMKNLIRSRADFEVCRLLSVKYGVNVTFIGHDVLLFKDTANKTRAGDIDTLLQSNTTDFLVERKRTVGKDTLKQIVAIRNAYIALLERTGRRNRKVQSVLYAESISDLLANDIRKNDIEVLQDVLSLRE